MNKRTWVLGLFFLSGIPALIYQLIWQRALFTVYGVNIQSVTAVVADFMLGLGLGALFGAYLSRRKGLNLLLVFGLLEIGIGVIGVFSLPVLKWVGLHSLALPFPLTAVIIFCMLLLPTLLMGASLPVLTEYLVRRFDAVLENVALLYAANTLGAAFSCFISAFIVFHYLGQQNSLIFAAVINFLIGAGALLLKKNKVSLSVSSAKKNENQTHVLLITCLLGFISLSYEIIWLRVVSFATGTLAIGLTLSLGYYLIGLGLGAIVCDWTCRRVTLKTTSLFQCVFLGSLLSGSVIPVMLLLFQFDSPVMAIAYIAIGSLPFGVLLPILVHLLTQKQDEAGLSMGLVYFFNIVGGTIGALLTGFVLLNYFSIKSIAVSLFVLTVCVAEMSLFMTSDRRPYKLIATSLLSVIVFIAISPMMFSHFYSRLLFKKHYSPAFENKYEVTNNVGDVVVSKWDKIYGGGYYDGAFNIDPNNDINRIFRAYFIPTFVETPKRVLMIGLSSGSWAQVIAHLPTLDRLDIVEINPGYEKIIEHYPSNKSLLKNKKVSFIFDDARRYLLRHPEKQYDLIIMNTSFHWRSYVSLLLSREMLNIFKAHLNHKGVLYFNTTESLRAIATVLKEFKYAFMLDNFIACTQTPFDISARRLRKALKEYKIDNKKIFAEESEAYSRLIQTAESLELNVDVTSGYLLKTGSTLLKVAKGQVPITDDNMGDEWR
jgi:predicted membrane-bound spermidine synthase